MYVNQVYGNPQAAAFDGLPLLAATYFFVIQVYCDFAGYTDVAIGTAQVLGFKLTPNFKRPYFASTLGELWRRWHITLITWFRDYLYIPLGGNRVSRWRLYLNMIIVFSLSGLWHGAQWTFVIWGSLNGVLLILGRMTKTMRDWTRNTVFAALLKVPAAAYFVLCAASVAVALIAVVGPARISVLPVSDAVVAVFMAGFGLLGIRKDLYERAVVAAKKLWMIFATFHLFVLGAVFFRANSVADAWYILKNFPGTTAGGTETFDVVQLALMILSWSSTSCLHTGNKPASGHDPRNRSGCSGPVISALYEHSAPEFAVPAVHLFPVLRCARETTDIKNNHTRGHLDPSPDDL